MPAPIGKTIFFLLKMYIEENAENSGITALNHNRFVYMELHTRPKAS